jgi:phage FluMu protein Com
MITLKRNEDIEIFQVELALKSKTKQSPFISILILTKEQENVSAETLQENLLPSLPLRACENLLKRLEQQGYLQKEQSNRYGYHQTYQDDFANYLLTDFGQQSATDQSFWIGEKGVYTVFVSKSNLIQQRIIRTERVERAEDNRNTNIIRTPNEIRQYENQILNINKTEVLIEDVEKKCFQLKSAHGILEIQANENETVLKLNKENQTIYQTDISIEENVLQKELLLSCGEFEYDEDKNAILTEFSKDNLSFKRKVKIFKPIFQRVPFNQVELENISHIPSDKQNADLWYWELLYKKMDDYFLDENSFKEFATELAKPIQLYFKIKVPQRKELAEILNEKEDAFYQIAKLETIDYLNY